MKSKKNKGVVLPFYPKKEKKISNNNITLLIAININEYKDVSPENLLTELIETFSDSTVLHSEYIENDLINGFEKIKLSHDNDNKNNKA